jgi:parvulin-like peptidyl-prolyl isomerase
MRSRLIWAVLALALCSCQKKEVPSSTALPDDAVARVGSEIITVKDFQDAMQTRPVGNDPAARAALLNQMIEFRAAVQEAKARGYDRDPEVKAAFDHLLANRLRAQDEATAAEDPGITPEESQRYYQEHQKDFSVPAKVRAAMIFVEAPSSFTPEKRAQRHARIEEAHAKAAREPAPVQTGFGPLAAEYSYDQATKYHGGDLGYLMEGAFGNDADALEPAVTAAVFQLKEPGQISDIIETSRGYYLLRLTERQPATVRSFASARNQIIAHLRRERATTVRANYTTRLLAGKKIEISRERLMSLAPSPAASSVSNNDSTPPALP